MEVFDRLGIVEKKPRRPQWIIERMAALLQLRRQSAVQNDHPLAIQERVQGRRGLVVHTRRPTGRQRSAGSRKIRKLLMGAKGLEPLTPSVSSWCSSQLS